MGAEESNEGIARGESGPCFHWHLTPGLSQAEASTRRSDQLPGPIGFTLGFFHPPETVAVRAAGHTCARISSVCSRAIRRQKFRCKPFKTGSSLFPMGEQTKPILSFGGFDRSWASSRDESLKERFDSSSPPVGFWACSSQASHRGLRSADPVPYTGDDQSEGCSSVSPLGETY